MVYSRVVRPSLKETSTRMCSILSELGQAFLSCCCLRREAEVLSCNLVVPHGTYSLMKANSIHPFAAKTRNGPT